MRTCSQCRFAHRGGSKEERLCMLHPHAPQRVDAERFECAGYEVSAYAYLESVVDAEERATGMDQKADAFRETHMGIGRDLREEAEQLRERYALARRMIEDLPNAEWRKVAQMRHMGRMRWEEIAKRMRYDVRQVQRIDGKAMRSVQEQLVASGVRR